MDVHLRQISYKLFAHIAPSSLPSNLPSSLSPSLSRPLSLSLSLPSPPPLECEISATGEFLPDYLRMCTLLNILPHPCLVPAPKKKKKAVAAEGEGEEAEGGGEGEKKEGEGEGGEGGEEEEEEEPVSGDWHTIFINGYVKVCACVRVS